MNKIALLNSLFALCALAPANAHAGADWTNSATCSKNADGSGNCNGTFAGFFNNADPIAQVQFLTSSTTYLSFYAQLNGTHYMCYFPSDSPSAGLYTTALAARSYFSISWNKSGTCTSLLLDNLSQSGL